MSDYENVQTVQWGNDIKATPTAPPTQPFMGGVASYQVPSEPVSDFRSNTVQHDLGRVLTVDINGSRSGGVQTFNTSELTGGYTDFLATARNNGLPARGNLTGDSIVTFKGMEVSLDTLEGMGEVKRTSNGYEAVGNSQQQQSSHQNTNSERQEAAHNYLPDGVELFSSDIEAQVAQAIEPTPQALYDSTMAKYIEGGSEAINWNELAYHSGMTPEEARQRADVVFNAFAEQASNIAKARGIDNPAEFFEWANSERREDLKKAQRELAFGRNTGSIKGLTNDYFKSLPPTVEALKRGGFDVRKGPQGEDVFNLNGTWLTPEAAARAGLI